MAAFTVTASQLRTSASQLRALNGQFKSQVGSLESQEAALAAMWEGEAKNAFHNAFNRDRRQMDNFYKLIDQYCQALENIAKKYELAERQNVSTAKKRSYK